VTISPSQPALKTFSKKIIIIIQSLNLDRTWGRTANSFTPRHAHLRPHTQPQHQPGAPHVQPRARQTSRTSCIRRPPPIASSSSIASWRSIASCRSLRAHARSSRSRTRSSGSSSRTRSSSSSSRTRSSSNSTPRCTTQRNRPNNTKYFSTDTAQPPSHQVRLYNRLRGEGTSATLPRVDCCLRVGRVLGATVQKTARQRRAACRDSHESTVV
jgi:hypothetical protein